MKKLLKFIFPDFVVLFLVYVAIMYVSNWIIAFLPISNLVKVRAYISLGIFVPVYTIVLKLWSKLEKKTPWKKFIWFFIGYVLLIAITAGALYLWIISRA